MIKFLLLAYRVPELSRAQFLEYWRTVHARLAIQAAPVMRIQRYVQNYPLQDAVTDAFLESRGAIRGDFDGVVEVWWKSFQDMAEAAGETPAEIAEAILQDERKFVDLRRSILWCGEEVQFWPESS